MGHLEARTLIVIQRGTERDGRYRLCLRRFVDYFRPYFAWGAVAAAGLVHSETRGFPYPCPPSFASARARGSGGSRTCGTCMSRPFWCARPCSSHPVDQRAAASSWACAGGPRTNNRRPTPTRCRSCCTFPIRSEVHRQTRAPRPRSRPRHCCWWGMYLATRLRDACRRG